METRLSRRGQHAGRLWVPVTWGAQRRTDAADPVRAELAAWLAVLPRGTCLTHVTAAQLLGLWLPPLPREVDVVVQLPTAAHPVRRPGLRALRGRQVAPQGTWAGLPVASVPDVLISLCRDLGDLDALMAVDCAVARGLVTVDELATAAGTPGIHGAPRLRRLVGRTRVSESWETVLREFHREMDAAVTPQHEVFDAGDFVARGDLWLEGTRVLHEYDGEVHRDPAQQADDLRRDRRLMRAGWRRRAYTSRDLVQRAVTVLQDIDDSLGRPHEPARVRGWHAVLRTSAVTPAGREQLWPRLAPD